MEVYEPLDIVLYSGSTFICLADTQGNTPTENDTTYWGLMAKHGEREQLTPEEIATLETVVYNNMVSRGVIFDAQYTHTDNNYTNADKATVKDIQDNPTKYVTRSPIGTRQTPLHRLILKTNLISYRTLTIPIRTITIQRRRKANLQALTHTHNRTFRPIGQPPTQTRIVSLNINLLSPQRQTNLSITVTLLLTRTIPTILTHSRTHTKTNLTLPTFLPMACCRN